MSVTPEIQTCTEHPDASAGWQCSGCNKLLCGECTARLLKLFYCTHCNELASQFTIPRAEGSTLSWVLDAMLQPVKNLPTTLAVIAGAVGMSLIESRLFGGRALLVALLAVGSLLAVVASARRGPGGRARVLGKTLATTALLWFPAFAYIWLGSGVISGKLGLLFAALGVVYVPAVVAVSATDVPVVRSLNPYVVFDWIWGLKRRYAAFVMWTAVLGFIAFRLASSPLSIGGNPMVNQLITTALAVAFLLMASSTLGTLVHVHGNAFEWGPAERYVDPLVAAEPTAHRKGRYNLEGGNESAADRGYVARSKELDLAREIKQHLAKNRAKEALALYLKHDKWKENHLNPKILLDLGVAAARERKNDVAVKLLTESSKTTGPFAARALFRLARLYEETLSQRSRAKSMYEEIIKKHPKSDVARPAQTRLDEIGGKP